MKKSTLMLSIALLSLATTFAQQSSIDKDIEMYEQVWDAVINKGEIEQINATHFDENITGISSPENIVGIKNFKAYYQNHVTGFSEREFTIKNIFGQNENIVKHWQFKGKHTGEFFGVPPTGKMVSFEGVTLVKMKNGKIAREQDFMDSRVFLQQLGLVSDPSNIKVIDNLYQAFAAGDIHSVLGGMHADIVWNEAEGNAYADGNPYIGPDAVLNGVFARVVEEFEYFDLADIQLHEMSNNQVLATLRYHGKLKKNSATIDAQVAHLWTLKDGKISAFQQYVDTKQLHDAVSK